MISNLMSLNQMAEKLQSGNATETLINLMSESYCDEINE